MKIPIKCSQCKTEFLKSVSEIKRQTKLGVKNNFCSIKCTCIFNHNTRKNSISEKELEYNKNPKKCLSCNNIILYQLRRNNYCGHACASTFSQKNGGNRIWSNEEKNIQRIKIKNNPYFNGDINKKNGTDINCPICNSVFHKYNKSKRICCSRKCYTEWSVKTGYMKGKSGGYRPHSGTSRKGWYKGIFCGSSWELAWVIYQLDHNILFTRNDKGFPYIYCNKNRKYYPDFYLPNEDKYIEIKNYNNAEVMAKIAQFPHKLDIMYKKELTNIFDYVIEKYGKDYIKLYEPNPNKPKNKISILSTCSNYGI